MTRTDRERWDDRYNDPIRSLRNGQHKLLQQYAPPCVPGARALDLACGQDRNALWLAAQGYTVDAVDISFTALRCAREDQQRQHLRGVNFIVADLDEFSLPLYAYNLVYVFRFLDRAQFPAIRARVRPGGVVIYETLNVRQLERSPQSCADHMLRLGELSGHFPGWDVLYTDDEGYTSAFVGRKPE
ncbi:MAG: methyltransferase domain-containing protein [Anaerolineae bacterium]|nr:methyltransferase domain-containing protein [Anaerolineae bacterium]